MEIDLASGGIDLAALRTELRSRVCIVGGGIAGLAVAKRITRSGGVSVTLLEAGGRESPDATAGDPFGAELRGRPHRGTGEARIRALGGCSWDWGGQLLPLADHVHWPVTAEEMRLGRPPEAGDFEAARFVRPAGSTEPSILAHLPDMDARVSWFLPYSRRNFGLTMGRGLLRHRDIQVALHAQAVELMLNDSCDRVVGVRVQTPDGRSLTVEADEYVLAAGTVETCRLLLASRVLSPGGVGNTGGQVGLHLHDHLTLTAATFSGGARERVLRGLRPWVVRVHGEERVHSLKLEAGPPLLASLGIQAAMAHITIEEPAGSGAGRIRELLRMRQRVGFFKAFRAGLRTLPRAASSLFRLAWEARVRGRRYVSSEATVRLQLNIAQMMPSASRVLLSEQVGEQGMPKAVVDWRIEPAELEGLRRLAKYLRERLNAAGLVEGVQWTPALFARGPESDAELLAQLDDARHAMGGACMGADPRTSVVDRDLRVHGVANLSIASPAVFPDGSAQLPTWTLIALCRRLAERLVNELQGSGKSRV